MRVVSHTNAHAAIWMDLDTARATVSEQQTISGDLAKPTCGPAVPSLALVRRCGIKFYYLRRVYIQDGQQRTVARAAARWVAAEGAHACAYASDLGLRGMPPALRARARARAASVATGRADAID